VTGSPHTDVAAYVLGVLSEAESAQFEAHLMNCPHCQLDLIELYQLPDVLDLVKRSWPEPPMPAPSTRTLAPGPRVLRGLMEEASVKRRRRRHVGILAGIAAASLVVAARSSPRGSPGRRRAAVTGFGQLQTRARDLVRGATYDVRFPARDDALGRLAGLRREGHRRLRRDRQVVVTPRDWGSNVELELRGILGPMVCQLVAISATGETSSAGSWQVPAKGYASPASPSRSGCWV